MLLSATLQTTYVKLISNGSFKKMLKLSGPSMKPSKHFNVVSTLSFGWYDVATWYNLKSTLKQHFVIQRRISQRWSMWKQRCENEHC